MCPEPILLNLHCDGESGNLTLEENVASILVEYFELWKKKQHDYGAENIASTGEEGIVIRINDKIARLKTLVLKKKDASNESIEDTWVDIIGYAIIGLTVRRGLWPKFKDITLDFLGQSDAMVIKDYCYGFISHEEFKTWLVTRFIA